MLEVIELYEDGGALWALAMDEHGNRTEACILPPDGHNDHGDDLPPIELEG